MISRVPRDSGLRFPAYDDRRVCGPAAAAGDESSIAMRLTHSRTAWVSHLLAGDLPRAERALGRSVCLQSSASVSSRNS